MSSRQIKPLQFKLVFLLALSSFIFVFSFQTISADVISINAGGSTEIAVTPDKYVEGFFSGITSQTAIAFCGDGIIQISNGETCDDGNLVSGDGCSSACLTETVTPSDDGGGGGGGTVVTPINIRLNPTEFSIKLAVDTTVSEKITITNLGTSQVIVGVSSQNLTNHVIFGNTSLVIPAGATVNLDIVFVALSEPGNFVGKIFIGGHEVLVSLNVKTKLLLFDSNIVVLNSGLKVTQGGELETLVTLIPLGDPERLDVTLNFVIKDYNGRVYLTKSDTLLIANLTELKRNFDVGLLPPGDYIVGLQLIYPYGVAPSSAHFRIVERRFTTFFGNLILFLIVMIVIIVILILFILLWKRRKEDEEEGKKKKEDRGLSSRFRNLFKREE